MAKLFTLLQEKLKRCEIASKILSEQTHICKICFKEIKNKNFHSIFNEFPLCENCLKKLNPYFKKFKIDGYDALAIYRYDEHIKKLIYQFKGCKDIELASSFLSVYSFELKLKYRGFVLVPLPSSKISDEERGFNHVEEIFSVLNLPLKKVLFKNKVHKQSDGTFRERKNVDKVIEIENGEVLKDKKVLIVDDICTTGSSLRCAIKLVKQFGPKCIKILVIAKRDFTLEEKEKYQKYIDILE